MARLVILQADVGALARVEVHVIQRVLGGKIGRRHVVIAAGDQQLQVRVLGEGAAQGFAGVGISVVGAPVPLRDAAAEDVILEVGLEGEFGADVVVEGRRVRRPKSKTTAFAGDLDFNEPHLLTASDRVPLPANDGVVSRPDENAHSVKRFNGASRNCKHSFNDSGQPILKRAGA